MYILQSVAKYSGFTCQGTHAFPTRKLAEKCIRVHGKHNYFYYNLIKAPVGTPLLDIKDNSNDEIKSTEIDNLNLMSSLNSDIVRIQSKIRSTKIDNFNLMSSLNSDIVRIQSKIT